MSVNKVFLLGNLGRDPEIRYTSNQVAVGNFTLATTERRKDQSGTWSDHTEWHTVVVFGNTASNIGKYLKKGSKVFVEGRLQTRKWQDKEGKDRYTTEIVADRVQFLNSKGEDHGNSIDSSVESFSGGGSNVFDSVKPASDLGANNNFGNSNSGGGSVSFDDDDIPF